MKLYQDWKGETVIVVSLLAGWFVGAYSTAIILTALGFMGCG